MSTQCGVCALCVCGCVVFCLCCDGLSSLCCYGVCSVVYGASLRRHFDLGPDVAALVDIRFQCSVLGFGHSVNWKSSNCKVSYESRRWHLAQCCVFGTRIFPDQLSHRVRDLKQDTRYLEEGFDMKTTSMLRSVIEGRSEILWRMAFRLGHGQAKSERGW